MKIPNKSVSWHSSKKKCVNFFLQINGFQPTITIKRRMVQRHQFRKSEQLSAPAKSHRRHQNNWSTRLSCRWQIKRHTLKVSDLYHSVFILLVTHEIALHLVLRKSLANGKSNNNKNNNAMLIFIFWNSSSGYCLILVIENKNVSVEMS